MTKICFPQMLNCPQRSPTDFEIGLCTIYHHFQQLLPQDGFRTISGLANLMMYQLKPFLSFTRQLKVRNLLRQLVPSSARSISFIFLLLPQCNLNFEAGPKKPCSSRFMISITTE